MRVVLFATVLTLILAIAVYAADPQVVQPLETGANPALTETPDLDVNQAELNEGVAQEGEVVLYTREEAAAAVAEHPVSPLMTEIGAALSDERSQRAELARRFEAAPDEDAAMDIQREIEALARNTELRILNIQIEHARSTGREDVAQEIEAAITEMTSPRPHGQPQVRRESNQH